MVKLSACVIVKNEEKNIRRWLDSLQKVVDECIVVDTGSDDATSEIAEEKGAKVYSYPWANDFSAAKNFALEKAQGDWVLFLDADEYFSPASLPKLRNCIERVQKQSQILGLICRLTNIDEDQNNRFISATAQVRIFRHLPTLHYVGTIHEMLENSASKGGKMEFVRELEIYHTGYSQKIIQAKLRRNLKFLQQDIAQNGEQPVHAHYLMDCYFGLGEYDKAIFYGQKSLASGVRFIGAESTVYKNLAIAMLHLTKPHEEIRTFLEEAQSRFPKAAEFPMMQGILHFDDHEYLQAEGCLRQGIELYQQPVDIKEGRFSDGAGAFIPTAYRYLGKLAKYKKQPQQAVLFFVEGLKSFRYDEALCLCLYDEIFREPAVDIIQVLNALYDKVQDASFLLRVLQQRPLGPVYAYYLQQAAAQPDALLAYAAADRFDAACVEAARRQDTFYRLGILGAVRQQMGPEQSAYRCIFPESYQEAWQVFGAGKGSPTSAGGGKILEVLQRMVPGKESSSLQGNPVFECSACIEEAANQFARGERIPAIRKLLAAYRNHAEESLLAYGLATLLQLDGQKEEARKVLLSAKQILPEMRALWKELQEDTEYPLVSIMIPTYNRPLMFEEALQSACAQDYTNIEIIVCDNGTQDDAEHLMKKYQKNLRVRYIRNRQARTKEENFAPFEKLVKGEYLQWLMDDDLLVKEKISKMMKVFREHPEVTLVTSMRGFIDEEGHAADNPYKPYLQFTEARQFYPGEALGKVMLLNMLNFIGEPSAVLFRRCDLQHHYWHAESRGYQTISDVAMWLELLSKGDGVIFREPLSYYRRHRQQEGQQPDIVLRSRLEWCRLMEESYQKRQFLVTEEEYRQAMDSLMDEYRAGDLQVLKSQASPAMWQQYEACMQRISQL